jgi:hypothetical protein
MLIRSKFDSETIPQAPYEVVARSNGEPVARRDWTPDTTVEYSNFRITTNDSPIGTRFSVRFDVTNKGDLDLRPPEGHISGGYPTTVYDSDAVGTIGIEDAHKGGIRPSETAELRPTKIGRKTLLYPEDGECPAASRDIELTLEYPNRQPDKLDITLQLGDEPVGVRGGDTIGCANSTVDEWSKKD